MGYPVLRDDFFKDVTANPEFWAKWKPQGPWSQSVVPLYEWEGILYVGVSSTEQLKIQGHWYLLNAKPELLANHWYEYQKLEDLHISATKNLPPQPQQPFKPPQIPQTKFLEKESLALSEVTRSDSGLTENTGLTQSKILDLPDGLLIENPLPKPKNNESTSDENSMNPLLLENTNTKSKVPTDEPFDSDSVVSSLLELDPDPSHETTRAASAQARPPSPTNDWVHLWSMLEKKFEHSVVFLLREGKAIPWKWDPRFQYVPSGLSYSIEIPSPFRIVHSTHKPYHGFMVQSSTMDLVYKTWNAGTYPEHLTLTPILSGEIMLGFLMNWGSKNLDTTDTLLYAEEATAMISRIIAKRPDLIKAA